ncbi:hypothetical protein [Geomonas subterranea]|uniref:hypothetical protein n=1 Tax=Geomonas subterranea TaxID=2847989 RepID=UPI001CD58E49|nr:hypothetical protein [Geomonas fuzhouensis]
MTHSAKVKEVLSGTELLRVESLHKQLPKSELRRKIVSLTVVYLLGLAYSVWYFWGYFIPLLCLFVIASLVYGLILAVLVGYIANRGNPLIFTDRGICAPYTAANFWREVGSYEWEEYKGINKVPGPTLFSVAEGTCLRIQLKDLVSVMLSRWTTSRGGNIMAINLIFFTPEQIVKAESIFTEYGISKR